MQRPERVQIDVIDGRDLRAAPLHLEGVKAVPGSDVEYAHSAQVLWQSVRREPGALPLEAHGAVQHPAIGKLEAVIEARRREPVPHRIEAAVFDHIGVVRHRTIVPGGRLGIIRPVPALKLTAVFMKVPEGYVAFGEELPGANTQAESLDEARTNLKEAVALVLEANRALSEDSIGKSRSNSRDPDPCQPHEARASAILSGAGASSCARATIILCM